VPELWVDRVTFSYDGQSNILSELNLVAREGQAMLIIGDNGSGKSTLGRLIAGLMKPTSGAILVGGDAPSDVPIDKRCHVVSYMGQISHLSILTASIADELASFSPQVEPLVLEQNYKVWAAKHALPTATDVNPRDLTMPDLWRLVLGLYALVLQPQVLVIDEMLCPDYNKVFTQDVLDRRHREGRVTIFLCQRRLPFAFDAVGSLNDKGFVEDLS
jgi:energy-coupling factor transporter ATP-binding protein EcfA2